MIVNDTLEQVLARLQERNLSAAIVAMEGCERMADYWRRGYKDPQLSGLYDNLLRRMYTICASASLSWAVDKSSYLSSVYNRLTQTARDWSVQGLRDSLEAYVSEVAMLELEPEHKQQQRRKDIYRRHHQLMSEWFDNVWLNAAWTDGQAEGMEALLLSPTIDSRDQQLLVSGITIAAVNHFDVAKFRTLMHVYQQSADETVRQRALVGWVLALHGQVPVRLYHGDMKELEALIESPEVCEELTQLQQQIVLCINAEKDNQTIQREIMPDLLKNSNFRLTRNGLEEIEENGLEDILHPDAEDRRMEQMEESFQRMQQMQRQGSDIYFGGFSQMKRFPFFSEICNWFVPFYADHPSISGVAERFSKNRFLQTLVSVGPFCNSDKYSFVLAFSQVMDRIPQQLREMMERGEATVGEVLREESQSAAYIRRTYLQDLYRFYRIYPYRSEFFNPFATGDEGSPWLFFALPVFSMTHLEPRFGEMAAFLIKRQMYQQAGEVIENIGAARRDFRYYMTAGYLAQRKLYDFDADSDGGQTDTYFYQQALSLQPDSERALLGYARALFGQELYQEALDAYERLLALQPGKRNYLLNRAVCLSKLGRNGDALKDLYRLNYETPDDENVNRVLAWALTCSGKYDQAENLYRRLMTDDPLPEDVLNHGLCLWLAGRVDDAADCFHLYLKHTEAEPLASVLEQERRLLTENGITEAEMQLMLYIL